MIKTTDGAGLLTVCNQGFLAFRSAVSFGGEARELPFVPDVPRCIWEDRMCSASAGTGGEHKIRKHQFPVEVAQWRQHLQSYVICFVRVPQRQEGNMGLYVHRNH